MHISEPNLKNESFINLREFVLSTTCFSEIGQFIINHSLNGIIHYIMGSCEEVNDYVFTIITGPGDAKDSQCHIIYKQEAVL